MCLYCIFRTAHIPHNKDSREPFPESLSRCVGSTESLNRVFVLLAIQREDHCGYGAQQGKEIDNDQTPEIIAQLDDALLDQHGDGAERLEKVHFEILRHFDGPVRPMAHVDHDQHGEAGDDDALDAHLFGQQFVTFEGADGRNQAGQGGDIA